MNLMFGILLGIVLLVSIFEDYFSNVKLEKELEELKGKQRILKQENEELRKHLEKLEKEK